MCTTKKAVHGHPVYLVVSDPSVTREAEGCMLDPSLFRGTPRNGADTSIRGNGGNCNGEQEG